MLRGPGEGRGQVREGWWVRQVFEGVTGEASNDYTTLGPGQDAS